MFGTNPIRAPEKHDGETLKVVEIFPTLQGEGHRAGQPAIFIRLGGCNLACDFCDTEFESFTEMTLQRISDEIQMMNFPANLIVITGGEPFRQNIIRLCESLVSKGYTVQIETNGTLWREIPAGIEIVCSPKNTGAGYQPIRQDLASHITAYKFIVSRTHHLYQSLPKPGYFAHSTQAMIFVQSMDEQDEAKNEENMKYAAELAMQHNYRMSIQLHKLLGID